MQPKYEEMPLEETSRQLQLCLIELLSFASHVKQAHWCVRGSNFQSVHKQLDEIHATALESVDEVAERITTLGIPPDGRIATVAEEAKLPACPEGFQEDVTAVALMLKCTESVVNLLRATIAELEEADAVSEDLLVGICATIEKQAWMLRSQLPLNN